MTMDWKKAFEDKEREHEDFRQRVTETAWDVGKDRGWCDDGVAEVLSDLGLPSERPTRDWRVTLTLEYHVTMEEADESGAQDDAMDALAAKLRIPIAHTFQTFADEGGRQWTVRVVRIFADEA